MTPELYAQVKDIFLRAAELEGVEREQFVEQACGGNIGLREEVLSLFQYHSPETILGGTSVTGISGRRVAASIDPAEWNGRHLGKYEITRFLASGGMGFVLEAHDATIDRQVAIKVLHSEFADDDAMRQRFLAEARAAGKLVHPNIITIHEVNSDGDSHFLVMEYIDGGSAADRLEREGPFKVSEATDIISQACQGLATAHAHGMVHRDIKPANLLITSDDIVKVSDFGVAKLTSGASLQLTKQGQLVGTPYYMSPEQCEGLPVDERSDIYSLGATYYCLLVGKTPYADRDSLISVIRAHCDAAPPDPRNVDPSIPAGCATIVQRAMAKSPADRYRSAHEMLCDLQRAGELSPTIDSNVKQTRFAEVVGRRRIGWVALLLTAAVILAVAFFAGRSSENVSSSDAPENQPLVPQYQDSEPIRVGILHSLSGTMALTEAAMVDACTLAIDEINSKGGIFGRKVEAILADGKSDESVFAEQAMRLIEEEGVCTIFGCCTSASRKAVKQVVEQKNHLLIYATNTEGMETSPNIVYLGGDPIQTVIPCVRWAYAFGQKRSFFLVGSDYVFPRVVNEIVKDQLESMGAELVGEEYLPLGSTEVGKVVDMIAEVQPDAIINTISGDSQTAFSRVLRSRGIEVTQFATGVGEQELRNTDISKLVDDYSISTYFQSIQSPENESFIGRLQSQFGQQRVANAATESSYAGVQLWAKAVEVAGVAEPLAIRDSILTQQIVAPSGVLRIDPKTQYAYRQSFIGRVESSGQFHIVWQSTDSIAPEPYPKSRTPQQWNKLVDDLYNSWGGQWSAPR